MDPLCLISTVVSGVLVKGIFSWPLKIYINTTAYLTILTTISSDDCFQQDSAPYHKSLIFSNLIFEHDDQFTVLEWPPQSPGLNPVEHLWDLVELKIYIMDVWPLNLQLCDSIMLIWAKKSLLSSGICGTSFQYCERPLEKKKKQQSFRQKNIQLSSGFRDLLSLLELHNTFFSDLK